MVDRERAGLILKENEKYGRKKERRLETGYRISHTVSEAVVEATAASAKKNGGDRSQKHK